MKAIFTVVVLCMATSMSFSQEVALPWDSVGRVYVLTAEMESQLLLFPDVTNLTEARLFRATDGTLSVEITAKFREEVRRERRVLTDNQFRDLRQKFNERAAVTMPSIGLDQSGRSALLWGSTLWSLFYYAPMIMVAINPEKGNVAAALPYIIAPVLGYFIPAILTSKANVTDGASSLALGGMFQGAIHGWALAALIQGDDLDMSMGAGFSVVTGITESVVGFSVASSSAMTEGHASMINTTAFYGALSGLYTGLLIGSDDNDVDISARAAGGAGLAGAAAGVIIGNSLGSSRTYTGADAGIYAIDGFLGATLPLAILAAVKPDHIDPRVLFGTAIATTALGLYVGTQLVRGRDYNSTLGPVLSTLGGALIGLGTGILIGDTAPTYLWWVGAAGGFAISYLTADWRPEGENSDHSSLNFQINPLGIAALTMPELSRFPMPLASVSYRWR
ncbi:MAG: hypothetical protein HYX66_09040 [Ignavibacteria bacterium]|nr:hypothetical protein [Ignavibacteria bacterium]